MQKTEKYYAIIPFLITQIVYLLTLAPSVTSEDSGELITAAAELGVAHPPGFPLFCISGYVFSFIPIDTIAWRLNYMSAFYGSATCFVLFLILRYFKIERFPAIITCCLLGVSWHFWNQAIIAEVYTLNAFIVVLLLYFLLHVKNDYKDKYLYAFVICLGVGLTNHYMLIMVIFLPMLVYAFPVLKEKFTVKRLMLVAICLLAPLSIYSYLYIAANSNPVLNWGNPSNLERLVAHVKRDAYKSLELSKDISISVKLTYFYQFLFLLVSQFTALVLIPFLLWGISRWKEFKKEVFLFAGIILFNSFILLSILKFSAEVENFTRVEEYYLPAYICIAILLSFGINRFYINVRNHSKVLAFSIILLPIFCANAHWPRNDFSKYYLAFDYNKAILESLPENAIYFPAGDYNSFPLIYLQKIEKIREDVLIADISGDIELEVIEIVKKLDPKGEIFEQLKINYKDRYPKLKAMSTPVIQEVLISRGNRPVFFTAKSDIKPYTAFKVRNYGLVYHVSDKVVESPPLKSKLVFKDSLLRNNIVETAYDDLGQSIYSNFYQMWGEELLQQKKIKEGLEKFDKAIQYCWGSKEGLNNLGSTLAEHKQNQKAIQLYERAITLYPTYRTARSNLLRNYIASGQRAKADNIRLQLDRILGKKKAQSNRTEDKSKNQNHLEMKRTIEMKLEKAPDDHRLHHDLGIAHANLGSMDLAIRELELAIKLNPKYKKAIKNLIKMYKTTGQKKDRVIQLQKMLDAL